MKATTAENGIPVREGAPGARERFIPVRQRERLLDAVAGIVAEDGLGGLKHSRVSNLLGMSSRTFYDLFADREDCVLALCERTLAEIAEVVVPAYEAKPGTAWPERIRAALTVLLEYLDERPDVARLMIVEALGAGPRVLERRAQVLDAVAEAIDEGRLDSKGARRQQQPPSCTAELVVGGVFSAVHDRVRRRTAGEDAGSLSESINQLMAMIVLPYRGQAAADRELNRRGKLSSVSSRPFVSGSNGAKEEGEKESPHGGLRLTYRVVWTLTAIANNPGCSNRMVTTETGISNEGQTSRLLAKLSRWGLIENRTPPEALGEAYTWYLTELGEEIVRDARAGEISRTGGSANRRRGATHAA
jgi:AcrR family transcriptional regulator/DNA-binding MarR family transcriptional regulator